MISGCKSALSSADILPIQRRTKADFGMLYFALLSFLCMSLKGAK